MGPKYGVTHRQVLREAGVAVDDNPARAAERLADPEVGFAYCDQARFAPRLHALTELRTRIVKRPLLTTLEVILPPVRGRKGTHLMTGYVHKPYPRIYAFLARHAGFDSALIMRGLEGGVIPSLQKAGRAFHYHDGGDEAHTDIDPVDLQIHSATRSAPLPEDIAATLAAENTPAEQRDTRSLARAACVAGLEALEGKPGPIREGLVFGAAAALWHLKRYPTPAKAAAAVRAGLDSGNIRRRLP
jgi:anthranilate phosphoribosyltransferase